jgi:1-acyl-sn-glycerol-3-phosphate acyltransferase
MGADSNTPEATDLTRAERASLAIGRFLNEQPVAKWVQLRWLLGFNQTWCRYAIGRRVYAENIDWLLDPPSDRGVVLCLNHRSYFDAYITMWALYEAGARWPRKIYFPVRSNFFYENPVGVAVNVVIGGGTLYPPIFRDQSKADLNKDALARLTRFLDQPNTLVGLHPEGTRGKGDDPYQLLPAQPGIGQIVLQARPLVVPVFINGLSNSYAEDILSTFRPDVRRTNPVIAVFGEPLDYHDLTTSKPRAALYKKCSDRILDHIRALGEREREIRAACARGEIGDDDRGWMRERRTHNGVRRQV